MPWNIEAEGASLSTTFQEDIRIGMKSIDRSDSTKSACQRRLRLRRSATTSTVLTELPKVTSDCRSTTNSSSRDSDNSDLLSCYVFNARSLK